MISYNALPLLLSFDDSGGFGVLPNLIQPNLKSLVEVNGIQTILVVNYNAINGNPTWKNGMLATLGGRDQAILLLLEERTILVND